ncbi:Integrase H2C2 domain-containing protein, partial [Aphis craccivora]
YLPGKYMYVADFLSRNYIKREEKSEEVMNDIVHTLGELEIKFENNKESEFRVATLNDEILNQIIENEMLYWGMRLIVPKIMRKYVIKKLHSTHLGMTKTVKKANQLFYWPGMKSEIENYIGAYKTCLKFSISKIKEPIKSHEIPMIPFYKIGMDIAECFGKNYKFPNYHQSNGLAEKAVGIAKNMNTPVAGLNYSPTQILQSRNLRTLINNFKENCLKPEVVVMNTKIIINKDKQINYYNKSAGKEENEFNLGDKVSEEDEQLEVKDNTSKVKRPSG